VTPSTTYCTILARNYLPRALSLADSVHRHHPDTPLVVLLIDVLRDADLPELPDLPGVRIVSTEALGLPEREVLDLATIYDLVEFATAVKPPLLKALLDETDQVVYLDPDTWVTSPMVELTPALQASEGGIVLTPHYLEQLPPEGTHSSEGHLLTVGVYNLGFCAVDQRARPLLDWWWGHLQVECLHNILSGLFVDQKWMDIGSTLFSAATLRHYGYNVGLVNLHERQIDIDADGYFIRGSGDRLRLFHFHAFDTSRPDQLSTRTDASTAHLRRDNAAVDLLCKEYAEDMIRHEQELSAAPDYPYWTDTTGRRIARQTRRVFRQQLQAGAAPPSPFVPEDAKAYARWRRSARKQVARDFVGDVAKAARCVAPDEIKRMKQRFPRLSGRVRDRYVDDTGIWG
jgi:hypothetical protein